MKYAAVLLLAIVAAGQTTSLGAGENTPIMKDEKAKTSDPSGTWRREYDWNGATVKEAFRLNLEDKGKVVGTLLRNDTTHEIRDGKIDGNTLSLSLSGDYQGYDWVAKYTGRIKADDVDGTLVVEANGQSWDFPWTPKRSVEMEDVVGTWQIRIESPDGNVFEPTLKITKEVDSFKSAYTSKQGYELDVKDLRVEKNQLMLTVTAEFDGNYLKVDYKGRPYGNKMKGTLKYDYAGNSGDGEFVAKRKQEKKKQ